MITIAFEIPDEVATYIKDELKSEPKSYIQNQLITPLVKMYESSLKQKRTEEAKAAVDVEIKKVKNDMKVEIK